MKPKILTALIVALLGVVMLCSCGEQEIAVSDVKDTDAYKELLTENEEIERKYEKAKSKYNSLDASEDAVSYTELMNRISKSTFTKLICKGGDDPEAKTTITDADMLKRLKVMLSKSIRDNKTKVSALSDKKSYTYSIVNEDNSLMAVIVYENDRVIFDSKPRTVYYCQGASFIGDSFYGDGSFIDEFDVSLPMIVYEADICYLDDVLMSADAKESVAHKLNKALGKKVDMESNDMASVPYHNLTVYYRGKAYELKFYDDYIEFNNMDDAEENTKYAYKSLDHERIFK
jgi:hypothetical protein